MFVAQKLETSVLPVKVSELSRLPLRPGPIICAMFCTLKREHH
jgi:hypothetical protein